MISKNHLIFILLVAVLCGTYSFYTAGYLNNENSGATRTISSIESAEIVKVDFPSDKKNVDGLTKKRHGKKIDSPTDDHAEPSK